VPVIVYGPIPCLSRAVHWVRLANEPKVTFAAAVDSKTGDSAWAGVATGISMAIEKAGTNIQAPLRKRMRLPRSLILIFFSAELSLSKILN
jgi:hypothetical protein